MRSAAHRRCSTQVVQPVSMWQGVASSGLSCGSTSQGVGCFVALGSLGRLAVVEAVAVVGRQCGSRGRWGVKGSRQPSTQWKRASPSAEPDREQSWHNTAMQR